jgi:triacylglycerol lipase
LQSPGSSSDKYVVALHGGGYKAQPTFLHWLDYAGMARDTGATVVVPIYPLTPQGTAATVVPQTADLLSALIDQHGAENVSVYGDSAGGGLALLAVQELVRRGAPTPARMVLISPWLDVSVSDPASQTIDDPVLNYSATKAAGLAWAGDLDPADPRVSPLFGSLDGLPPTVVYSGSLDLLSPDSLRLRERALTEGADFTFVLRKGLIHDWAEFLFLPEASAVRPDIYRQLGLVAAV